VLGVPLVVSGEVEGTAAISGSFAFVARSELERLLRVPGVASYILVRSAPGVAADELAQRINRSVAEVTATTREGFVASEQSVLGDMATDIVRGMILVGFVIGVAVAGLVSYSQTLTQLRDYGVLRALGMSARSTLRLVLAQVAVMVAGGLAAAIALTWLLGWVLPNLSATLVLSMRTDDVVLAGLVAGAVTVGAAVVPLVRVVRVEPASVFGSSS
jgi:putative ABC transport system permease protein